MRKYVDFIENASGGALQGASVLVLTYPAGTVATLYSDSGGLTPIANPLTTDATGKFEFYAADGQYTFQTSGSNLSPQIITDVAIYDEANILAKSQAAIDAAPVATTAATTATTQAGIATTQAGIATTQAGIATTKATDAANYAAAAATGAKFYDTIALGVNTGSGGVAIGASFGVKAGGTDGLKRPSVYKNVDGTAANALLIFSVLRASEFDAVFAITASGSIILMSEYGKIALEVKDDGSVATGSLSSGEVISEQFLNSVGAGMFTTSLPGWAWAILDGSKPGMVGGGFKDDGTWSVNAAEVTTLNGTNVNALIASVSAPSPVVTEKNYDAEIAMVMSYGQSLSNGTSGLPSISLTQRFDNLRFSGGVRTADSGTPYTSLIPLVEQDNSATWGETPITGATDMIKERILTEDGLSYTQHSYQILGSAPGQGSTQLAGLVKGQPAYTRVTNDMTNGYTLANAAGKSFKVLAFFWTQGESDYSLNTTAASYKTGLIGLRNDIETDARAITGQTENVVCISYQTQAHASFGHANDAYLAVAQLDVAKTAPHHYVACPLYHIDRVNVHLSAANYKKLGAYYGVVYKRVVVDGLEWKPLMPIETSRQGKIAYVRFNVPKGKLVSDTVAIPDQGNWGLTLVDASNVALTISSVVITGPDTVKVTAAATIPANAKLRYGYGAGGNLRDQQGDTIVFDGGGLNYPMHNWCVIFEEILV